MEKLWFIFRNSASSRVLDIMSLHLNCSKEEIKLCNCKYPGLLLISVNKECVNSIKSLRNIDCTHLNQQIAEILIDKPTRGEDCIFEVLARVSVDEQYDALSQLLHNHNSMEA